MINMMLVLGIAAFIFLQIGFRLDEKHDFFKFLSLFFAILCLVMIGKAGIDSNQICEIKLNYTDNVYVYGANFTGYHWDYDYDLNPAQEPDYTLFHVKEYPTYNLVCFTDTTYQSISTIFYKLSIGFMGLLFLYIIIFLFKLVGEYLGKV